MRSFYLFSLGLLLGALVAYLVKLTRRPKPPKVSLLDLPEVRTAVHEAGHAILAFYCTKVREIKTVSILEEMDASGKIDYKIGWGNKACVWCCLVIGLGGIAAENMIFGKFRTRKAKQDLLNARGFAEDLEETGKPPWGVPEGVSKAPPFESMYERAPKNCEALKIAYATARKTLERRRGEHAYLTSMLLAHKEIPGTALEKRFGSRSFLTSLGFFKAKFL